MGFSYLPKLLASLSSFPKLTASYRYLAPLPYFAVVNQAGRGSTCSTELSKSNSMLSRVGTDNRSSSRGSESSSSSNATSSKSATLWEVVLSIQYEVYPARSYLKNW